jgi:hypothetical protein
MAPGKIPDPGKDTATARHGIARVPDAFRGCKDERARDARFAKVLGVSLDEAGEEWLAALAR